MDQMDTLMVEYIEAQGHAVDVGLRTNGNQGEMRCDDEDVDLDRLFAAAWDHACNRYDEAFPAETIL